MDMQITKREPKAGNVRTDSVVFYDTLEKALRSDPEVSVRVDPEGRTAAAIRQALRGRGLYVQISARTEDRPYITIILNDTAEAASARVRYAPKTVQLTEEEAQALFDQYGITDRG